MRRSPGGCGECHTPVPATRGHFAFAVGTRGVSKCEGTFKAQKGPFKLRSPVFHTSSRADRQGSDRALGDLGRPGGAGTLSRVTLLPGDPDGGPQSWTGRLSALFGGAGLEDRDPQQVIPPEDRKAAMASLDRTEHKLALFGLILATLAGIGIPLWVISQNRVDKHGKSSIGVAPDAWLLMAAILVFCIIGFVALWKGKRTLVTFSLFLIGFGFTLFIGIIGFAFILLGGWLMLRAWRLNKYGSTSAKVVAREAASSRSERRERGSRRSKEPARATKTTSSSGDRRPPTANKRYTPKAPPRKKIPKPTE